MRLFQQFFIGILCLCVCGMCFSNDLGSRIEALGKIKRKDLLKHRMEIAVMALKASDTKTAAEHLDFVLADIESFYTDTEAAKKARSLWANEGRKTFKGEPYERAMAYYYRGLTYLMEGDYDNAHASFKGGQLQDAMAEGHDKRTDFVLLMAMQTWAARLMRQESLAEQSQQELEVYRQGFHVPSPETHTMVVIETGLGPRKIRDGVSGERLVFRRGKKFNDSYASIVIGDYQQDLRPIEDIYYQASTRGARAIDFVNRGKAVFKQQWGGTNSSIADIAATAALFTRTYNDVRIIEGNVNGIAVNAGVGGKYAHQLDQLALAASVVSLLSSKVKAKSDIRAWTNLPDHVHIGFVAKSKILGEKELPIVLFDRHKNELETIEVPIQTSDKEGSIVWFKVH